MDKKTLELLVGRSIRVDRGGPESRMGKLLAVKDDHIVIFNEDDGMLYYRIDHIKSLSADTRDYSDVVENAQSEPTYIPKYIDGNDFCNRQVLLSRFRQITFNT